VLVPIVRGYHLERTLRSGQCFRWVITPQGARGVLYGTAVSVRQDRARLVVTWQGPSIQPARLAGYLGADQPLRDVERVLGRDRVLRRLLPMTSGIALMRQEPWECLVSFVISAFNNIPKIQMSVQALARCLGERIPAGVAAWTFPSPQRLAQAGDAVLRGCVLGYRARYVRALARLVADGELDLTAVAAMPFDEARRLLLELPGVGEKVADCVLLFGLGFHEAFPVDVWVQRAVQQWYFDGRARTPRAIRAWAYDRFGPMAGYAQQHLFAGARAVLSKSGAGGLARATPTASQ
jgi:N-glycosylase/DNA lyase